MKSWILHCRTYHARLYQICFVSLQVLLVRGTYFGISTDAVHNLTLGATKHE